MCPQQTPKVKPTPLHLQVFLSSPGDVADERSLVRRLLKEELPYDAFLRGRVTIDLVNWDDPAAPTPMLATLTPQEAVSQFGPKPSECDIVIVILWSRLGTHLDLKVFRKSNGEPYLSGTEWEYEDACNAQPQPAILVYRRVEEPKVGLKDPDRDRRIQQYDLVEKFFSCFQNPDGSFRRSFTTYNTPTELQDRLAKDLKRVLHDIIEPLSENNTGSAAEPPPLSENNTGSAAEPPPLWPDSPYPGLRPFNSSEATIFFGRGGETDDLIARLRDCRFLAVVGASGTGRSSLVRAGLLPRLVEGAIEGSQHWCMLEFRPRALGKNPFLALANALLDPQRQLLPQYGGEPIDLAEDLKNDPASIARLADQVLHKNSSSVELIFLIDQFEELFTHAAGDYQGAFIDLLEAAGHHSRVRVIVTLREDFQFQALRYPKLATLLQIKGATYLLGPPGTNALSEIIRKPAERAGVELEDGLVNQIRQEAVMDPRALPLIAFCLRELYERHRMDGKMTLAAYQSMGGLHEAIARRSDEVLEALEKKGANVDAALAIIFSELVTVDPDGRAIRKHMSLVQASADQNVKQVVNELIKLRLLIYAGNDSVSGSATLELAHERLLDKWKKLEEWIKNNRNDMLLWADLEHAVRRWLDTSPRSGYFPTKVSYLRSSYLWKGKTLKDGTAILNRKLIDIRVVVDPDVVHFIRTSRLNQWITRFSYISMFLLLPSIFLLILILVDPSLMPRTTMPVGSFTQKKHPFELHDVLGNVWEWTSTCVEPPAVESPTIQKWCFVGGASWDNYEKWKINWAYSFPLAINEEYLTVGFRVARGLNDEEKKLVSQCSQNDRDCIQNALRPNCPNDVACPPMAILPQGKFERRSLPSQRDDDKPCEELQLQGWTEINEPFAIGKDEVTFDEWDACVKDENNNKDNEGHKLCNTVSDNNWGRGQRPVINVTWKDADGYVKWLSKSGTTYRLPSEQERQYAARGDKPTCRWWGHEISQGDANCEACGLTRKQFFDWLWLSLAKFFKSASRMF